MTNLRSVSAWAALLAGLLLGGVALPVQAHGAAPAREIDTRLLLDDDGLVGYGGCYDGTCQPAFPATGLDLLSLDAREAYLAGQPALVFRISLQTQDPSAAGRAIDLQVQLPSQAKTFHIEFNNGNVSSTDFDQLQGPFPVGDGHPQAIDGWCWLSSLGLAPGDELTGITVTSTQDGQPDDVMPGNWYEQGVLVPHVADDPTELTDSPEAGTYTVQGPARLLDVTANATADLATGTVQVPVTVRNPLGSLSQFVMATLLTPDGLNASLDAAQLNLEPTKTRDLSVTVGSAAHDGNVTLVLTSDLGAQSVLEIAVKAPPPAETTANTTSSQAAGKNSPSPAATALGLVLLASVALRRRDQDKPL